MSEENKLSEQTKTATIDRQAMPPNEALFRSVVWPEDYLGVQRRWNVSRAIETDSKTIEWRFIGSFESTCNVLALEIRSRYGYGTFILNEQTLDSMHPQWLSSVYVYTAPDGFIETKLDATNSIPESGIVQKGKRSQRLDTIADLISKGFSLKAALAFIDPGFTKLHPDEQKLTYDSTRNSLAKRRKRDLSRKQKGGH